MNRILLDKGMNGLEKVTDNNIVLDINKNVNLLINNSDIDKYVFNINNGNVNIMCTLFESDDVSFEFNIYGGDVSFNNFSLNSGNENITVNLKQDKASININNSIISNKSQLIDILVNHDYSRTNSNVYNCAKASSYDGITFNVVAKVKKKCKNCVVNQDSKIITLDGNNKNKINPILLIDEYEVDAKHSAFIGEFNEKDLFYLQSRGLTKEEASRLLLIGFLVGTMDVDEEEKEFIKSKIK